jgi:hypothetical protein
MSETNTALLRAQVRAKAVADAMKIIGQQNERQAEWVADLLMKRLDSLFEPVDNVIQIDATADPGAIMAQIHELSSDLARNACIAAMEVMKAALTLGVKIGQAK